MGQIANPCLTTKYDRICLSCVIKNGIKPNNVTSGQNRIFIHQNCKAAKKNALGVKSLKGK